MSKTIDELEKIYDDAYSKAYDTLAYDVNEEDEQAKRAGIAAVVRALRDEFTKLGTLEFQDGWAVLKKFNKILGDAGERVGTHGSPELDEDARKLERLEAAEAERDRTRAAIAAVAEWIDEHHQIDKDGSVHCALTWQYTAKSAPTPPEVK